MLDGIRANWRPHIKLAISAVAFSRLFEFVACEAAPARADPVDTGRHLVRVRAQTQPYPAHGFLGTHPFTNANAAPFEVDRSPLNWALNQHAWIRAASGLGDGGSATSQDSLSK